MHEPSQHSPRQAETDTDELVVQRDGPVLRVTFNRPDQRNAMTWRMYDGLADACARADDDPEVRVLVLRGAGGSAFVAGTDIGQFTEFDGAAAGLAYERRTGELLDQLARVSVPTVAVITGYCVGGGLAIAALCDLRIATTSSRFGIPVARTLGNCLAMPTYAVLVDHFGSARTLDMLMRARLLDTDELAPTGFLAEVCAADKIDNRAQAMIDRLCEHAPLSLWAAKQAVHRLRSANLPDGEDLVAKVYGSEDFQAGVRGFLTKQRPDWTGR